MLGVHPGRRYARPAALLGSAAVAELEGRVGTRLLHRTTRKVSPTQDGVLFYERCVRLVADVEETESLL
jgi:DNA-binding transcriptional LysR family regulator